MTISLSRKLELQEAVRKAGRGGTIEAKSSEEAEFITEERGRKLSGKDKKAKPSDGSSADYYKLPRGAKQLQDLIAYKDMNAQMGEIFRANYRYGKCPHSDKVRELNKIVYYARAELTRLKKYESIDPLGLSMEDL